MRLVCTEAAPNGVARSGALVDDQTGRYFPIVDGVPRLLPYCNDVMAAAASELKSSAELAGLSLPASTSGSGAEIEHYELNGIRDLSEEPFDRARLDAALRLLPDSVATLVDVGAGPATFLRDLSHRRPDVIAIGLERSSAAVAAATPEVPMLQGTADALPFADNAVDCCVTMETLEHLPDPIHERALSEMGRVARRFVLVNVPYRERRLQAVCPHCACSFNPNYHMRSYDDARLAGMLPGFVLQAKVLLPRQENLVKAFASPFRRNVFEALPYALCPQCGQRSRPARDGNLAVEHAASGRLKQVARRLAERLPKVSVRGEIIALYERRSA